MARDDCWWWLDELSRMPKKPKTKWERFKEDFPVACIAIGIPLGLILVGVGIGFFIWS